MPKSCHCDHRLTFRRLPLGAFGKQDQDYYDDEFNPAGSTLARPHFGLENGVHLSGLRKIRWRRSGAGKRGGLRLIYFWSKDDDTIYMLFVYPKSDQEDLTPSQLRVLSKLVREELK